MEPTPTDILWLVGLPALLAALAMLGTRPWRRGRDLGGWGAAIAIAGGFAIAFDHVFGGTPPFPPGSAQQWLFFLMLPVVIVAAIQAFVRSSLIAVVASAILVGVTPWLLLRRVTLDEPRLLWMWIIGAGVVMIAWWIAMEGLARRGRGASLPMLFAIVMGAAGLTIINAHNATLGQVTGAVAVPFAIIAAAALGSRGASLARGGALAASVLLPGLLLSAHFFADLSARDLALLASAPLAAWAGELPALGKPDSWKRAAVRTVAILLVIALPVATAMLGLKETLDEQTGAYSY